MPGDLKHRTAELLCSRDRFGEGGFQKRKDGLEDRVEDLVEASLRPDAVKRLDDARTKHIGDSKGKFEEVVLGLAFDAGPHAASAFGGVGARAGDIKEGHLRVEFCERGCGCHGEVVGEVLIFGLFHAGRGDAKGEEAGVVTGEFGFDVGVVEEVGVNELVKFGVVLVCRSTHDGEDVVDARIKETFAQNALADHAGSSKEDDIHAFML